MAAARFTACAVIALGAGCFNPTGQVDTGDTLTSTTTATTTETGTSTTTSDTTDTSSTSANSATTDATTTTGPSTGSTTAGVNCADEPDPKAFCIASSPLEPFCDPESGECVECVETVDCGSNGVCDPDAKVCVECVEDLDCMGAETPACNPETKTCGCTEHDECPDTACDLDKGTCFPAALTTVVHARPAMGPDCAINDVTCDQFSPCCSIEAAIDFALTMGKGYVVVRVTPGMNDAPDHSFDLPMSAIGKHIAVLGEGGPVIEATSGAPAVLVNQASWFYAAGLRLRAVAMGTSGAGVSCFAGTGAWVDDFTIESFGSGVGLFSAGCPMRARRVQIRANRGGAWAASGGTIRLENTTVAQPKDYALKGEMGGSIDVVFSTITERSGLSGHLLTCTGAGTKISARNSALLASPEAGSSACAGAKATNSVVTDVALEDTTVSVITQDAVGPLFVDWMAGDLHVVPAAMALNGAASRSAGDPLTDVDREPRPLALGASDWAGADRP